MLNRRTLEEKQRQIEMAGNPGALVEAQASYARTLVSELLSLISDVRRNWEANHLDAALVQALTTGTKMAGSSLSAVQLVNFSTALAGFEAFMGLSMSDPAVTAVAQSISPDFAINPIMLVDGVALTPREIILRMDWTQIEAAVRSVISPVSTGIVLAPVEEVVP